MIMEETRVVNVTAYPYAVQYGTIEVPVSIKGEDEVREYIEEHFNDVWFGRADLDYEGTDFDIEDSEEETEED